MVRLEFKNAVVEDTGLGVRVNGKSLEDIISTALGTLAKDKGGSRAGLDEFYSNACDIKITISPQPVYTVIEDGLRTYDSIENLEEFRYEQYKEKIEKTDTEI